MTFRIFITAVIAGRLESIQWSTSQIYFLAKCRCELGLLMIVKSILWINFHKKHLVYWFLIVMEIIACKEKIFLHLIECKEYVYILCETSSKRRLIVISLYWCTTIGWIPLRKDGKCNWWKHTQQFEYVSILVPKLYSEQCPHVPCIPKPRWWILYFWRWNGRNSLHDVVTNMHSKSFFSF